MKEIRELQTKLDGLQTFEFWSKDEFTGRETRIYSSSGVDVIPVEDDFIVCDWCNADIEEFPVPVFHGNALCPECYKRVVKDD